MSNSIASPWVLPAFLFLSALLVPLSVSAAAGDVDTNFNPNAFGSHVFATAVEPDGQILLGGQFTGMGGQPRNNIARLSADGTDTFNLGTSANGTVYSVAHQPDGQILLGGVFTSVNGQPRTNIVRLNTSGSVESTNTFNPGTGANDTVYSVAVQADGKILLGGRFSSVNGQPRNNIARLNSNGTLENTNTFNPGTAPNGFVLSVALQADGQILLGGSFTSVNGVPLNRIARLNQDGTLDSTFNPGTGANSTVRSLAVQADGKILLVGDFTGVNGQPLNYIARLNTNGTVEGTNTFNPGTGANSDVWGVAVQADGKILLGGQFTSVNSQPRNLVARLLNDPATQALTIPTSARVQWLRGGAGPEVEQVTFELSTDGGTNWSLLGPGARIAGGWELTGLNLNGVAGSIRARGRTVGGCLNGSSGLVEAVAAFSFPPPSATTLAATAIASTNATLNGTVNPNGLTTTAWFEWGTTTNYGYLTLSTNVGNGTNSVAIATNLTGLTPGTTYHFRVVATNAVGLAFGTNQSFTTLGTNADLAALTFNDAGSLSGWRFDYGGVTHSIEFDATQDACGNAASGSLKVTFGFDAATLNPSGNNKGAVTLDLPSPIDLSTSVTMEMDLKIDTGSAADAGGQSGYFRMVIRNTANYDFNSQFGGGVTTNGGWHRIRVSPLTAPLADIHAITLELNGGAELTGPVTLHIDNIEFTKPVPLVNIFVSQFNNAGGLAGWRFDYGGVTNLIEFEPTEDASSDPASGSLKATFGFDAASLNSSGNNKGAITIDLPTPLDGSSYLSMEMDLKIKTGSAADGSGQSGYFLMVIRNTANYDFNSQFGGGVTTNAGWRHISIPPMNAENPLTGPRDDIHAITLELNGGPLTGPVIVYVDNLKFTARLVTAPYLTSLIRRGNGSFQFAFTHAPGAGFSLLTTTNLALPLSNWTLLGSVLECPAGQYQFTDTPRTNDPQRFYRVRYP